MVSYPFGVLVFNGKFLGGAAELLAFNLNLDYTERCCWSCTLQFELVLLLKPLRVIEQEHLSFGWSLIWLLFSTFNVQLQSDPILTSYIYVILTLNCPFFWVVIYPVSPYLQFVCINLCLITLLYSHNLNCITSTVFLSIKNVPFWADWCHVLFHQQLT